MELQILHWFESIHNPVLNPIMYFFTLLGDKGLIWIVLAALMLFVLPDKYRAAGLSVAIALIISLIMCNLIMKNLWHRVRPFNADPSLQDLYQVFESIHDWSFPSGHTSASFASAIAIFMWHKKEGKLAIVGAALISISRLYLTVHYPTDVLASLILGSFYGVLSYLLVNWMMERFPKMKTVFACSE